MLVFVFCPCQALQQAVYASASVKSSVPSPQLSTKMTPITLSRYSQNLVNRSRNTLGGSKVTNTSMHDIIVEASEKISHSVEKLGKSRANVLIIYSSFVAALAAMVALSLYLLGSFYGSVAGVFIFIVLGIIAYQYVA